MKNWKTSLFGILAGIGLVSQTLSSGGFHVGHVGAGDVLGLIGGVCAAVVGVVAKDHNVTGGTVQQ